MKIAFAVGISCVGLLSAPPVFGQATDPPAEAEAPAKTAAPEAAPAEPAAKAAAPATEAPPPKIDLHVAPTPPIVERSYHVHDGFYLRLNLGVTALGNKYDLAGVSADSHGGTLAFDVLVGGTPAKGLAIGGALLGEAGVSHSVERDGRSVGDANVRLGLLGPFVDGFFDPKGGFHMGGAVGLAALTLEGLGSSGASDTLTGFGGAAWAGYDAWVADEWAIGGLVRFGGAITKKSDDAGDLTASSMSFGLMLSVLHH